MMKSLLLYLMSLLYVAAGILHFVRPRLYMKIMPPWLPWHSEIVFISGVLEIVLGLLLLPVATRSIAAWGIIILLILVFPANVQMAINHYNRNNPYLWIAIARLPLQVLLIWWAWQYTK